MAFSDTPPLTEKDVHDAADALNAAGESPSYRKVRDRLGRGSFTNLKRWLHTWRPKDRPETPIVPMPSTVSALVTTMASDLWAAALVKAEALASEKLADAVAAKETAEMDLRQMVTVADEYAAENDRLRAEQHELNTQLEQACQWGRDCELQANALQAEVNTLRDTLTQLVKGKRTAAKSKAKRSRATETSAQQAA